MEWNDIIRDMLSNLSNNQKLCIRFFLVSFLMLFEYIFCQKTFQLLFRTNPESGSNLEFDSVNNSVKKKKNSKKVKLKAIPALKRRIREMFRVSEAGNLALFYASMAKSYNGGIIKEAMNGVKSTFSFRSKK